MIYLASPYSHPDKTIVTRRFAAVCKATAEMMRRGHHVFSPIAHSHVIAKIGKLDLGWEFWRDIDFAWIRACGHLCVFTLDGWRDSVGVQAELSFAVSLQIPIYMRSPAELRIADVHVGGAGTPLVKIGQGTSETTIEGTDL
jgi:hypothetical protein